MSTTLFLKYLSRVATVMVASAVVCAWGFETRAQQIAVTIRVLPELSRVSIEGSCEPTKAWSFADSYAGVVGLGSRIEKFALLDQAGLDIQVRKIAPGQFESTAAASRFRYEVNLAPPNRAADSALVSWLNRDRGILLLGDLLPLAVQWRDRDGAANIEFVLPEAWRVYSTEPTSRPNEFRVTHRERAVFAVGSHLRASETNESGMALRLVTDGEWAFSEPDVAEMVSTILRDYKGIFVAMPAKEGSLILFPFPQTAGAGAWTAETKGSTIILLLGKLPSRVGALAQLSAPLTHELFHLWVPNGLALDGDYGWFYEGFTVYQSARSAVELGFLTFPEFLNSIAHAYDGSTQTGALSLIEASKRRFTVGQSSVYSKGEVVAFIYDLKLRSSSRGKKSLVDVYRKLFREHGIAGTSDASDGSDGNQVATEALAAAGSKDFSSTFISNPVSIDLARELNPFGLQVERLGLRTYISVNEKLSKQQRELLRQLGYNDATHARKVK